MTHETQKAISVSAVALAIALLAALSWKVEAAPLLSDIVAGAPAVADTGDEIFSVSDIDGLDDDITNFIIGRNAGFSNAAGIYDPTDPTRTLELWDGTVDPGFSSGVVLSYNNVTATYSIDGAPANFIDLASPEFGMYIFNGVDTFYSQTALNADGFDHLLTFATEGLGGTTNGFDWVFAWEDLPGGGDMDWNDISYGCIDCVAVPAQVPEPSILMLMSAGLLGLVRRRIKPKKV